MGDTHFLSDRDLSKKNGIKGKYGAKRHQEEEGDIMKTTMKNGKTDNKFANILRSFGKLGLLTCYRIHSFLFLLNSNSRNFKYQVSRRLSDQIELYDFSTKQSLQFTLDFTIDEWGRVIENKLEEGEQEKVASDFLQLRRYLLHSLFRTIAYKSTSYRDLNLNPSEFFNGIMTPMFLELYNFYDLDVNVLFDELRKNKIEITRWFMKSELDLQIDIDKDAITISCKNSRIVIPRIKITLDDFTGDYKSRGNILPYLLHKYWIGSKKAPSMMMLDPFNMGQPIQFFSAYLIDEAKRHEEFKRDWEHNSQIKKSKISIPPTIVDGKKEILFQIGEALGGVLFIQFREQYVKRFAD